VTDRRAETTTFLSDALASAVELGIATPDDVLKFATPEVLSTSLPRPLWARLMTACLGAARVDATLIVETIGIPNLCEHLPAPIVWACLSIAAARALGNAELATTASAASATTVVAPPPSAPSAAPIAATAAVGSSRVPTSAAGSGEWHRGQSTPAPLSITPPPAPREAGPDVRTGSKPSVTPPATPIPAPSAVAGSLDIEIDEDDDPIVPPPPATPPTRVRGSTRQPFRPASTATTRPTAHTTARRPQAQAAPTATTPPRRGQTEANDYEIATDIRSADDYRTPGSDDLVDWATGEETMTGDDDFGRKR
jgi:hypothetical protein